MKYIWNFGFITLGLLITSCQDDDQNAVSQQYVHKYGFVVSKDEWNARDQDGKVVSVTENQVTVTKNYENGILHGETTYSFPYSDKVERLYVYDQGELLKQVLFDREEVPIREEQYELDGKIGITLWDEKGAPLSVEEYDQETLVSGTYYHPYGDIESEVVDGTGTRTCRDREGKIVYEDEMKNGFLKARKTYFPNGQLQMITHYQDYLPHGEKKEYSPDGDLSMITHWDQGTLSGKKEIFRNGRKWEEIMYANGKKEGLTKKFDEEGNLCEETMFKKDQKHGLSKKYSLNREQIAWYYLGDPVPKVQFDAMMMNHDTHQTTKNIQ